MEGKQIDARRREENRMEGKQIDEKRREWNGRKAER